jgi:hypothetical protein
VLGNHDCYSGAGEWIEHFRDIGFRVLLNEHVVLSRGASTLLVGGVVRTSCIEAPRTTDITSRMSIRYSTKLPRIWSFYTRLIVRAHCGNALTLGYAKCDVVDSLCRESFERYQACFDKADRARFCITESRRGR